MAEPTNSTLPQNPTTEEQKKESLERSRKQTERLKAQRLGQIKPGNAEFDTKLTTADHVGQHPSQPYKDDEQEGRKVGDYDRVGLTSGEELETAKVAPAGAEQETDEVVLREGEEEDDAAERVKRGAQPMPGVGELEPVGTHAKGEAKKTKEVPSDGKSVMDPNVANLPQRPEDGGIGTRPQTKPSEEKPEGAEASGAVGEH